VKNESSVRLIAALVLSFGIFYFWSKYVAPAPKPAEHSEGKTQQAPPAAIPAKTGVTSPPAAVGPSASGFLVKAEGAGSVLENSRVRLQYSPQGAALSKVVLKTYKESANPKKETPPLALGGRQQAAAVRFTHPALQKFDLAPFSSRSGSNEIQFVQEDDQFRVEKRNQLVDETFGYRWSVTITPKQKQQGDFGEMKVVLQHHPIAKTSSVNVDEAAAQVQGHRVSQQYQFHDGADTPLPEPSKMEPWVETRGRKVEWVLAGDRYFMQAVIPAGQFNPNVEITPVAPTPEADVEIAAVYPLHFNGTPMTIEGMGYAGPKSMDQIKVFPELETTIDLGKFRFIALPILKFLNIIHSQVIANYGIAIVILTLIVRIVLYPIVYRQMQSMKKMQKIQPELDRIREKYKNDKQRLNQEMIQFMRANKVNPLGGCLPLFLQLPIFFALWQALSNTADLFHAPFVFWIHDLSAKDPFYIMPVVMSGLMFLQQWLTPKSPTMDKTQQKIMMFMPLLFTGFMLNLPSGLTLYMVISSLFGLIQQLFQNRKRQTGSTQAQVART
jgi:YidC/Oxa1 family membrane protein insertase